MTGKLSHPRLLTIPREIRDLIYSHLTRELLLRTVDKIGAPHTIVTLRNVPHVDVMLVHPQIYDEYHEVLQQLSATVVYLRKDISRSWAWSSGAQEEMRDRDAMSHVKTVTLRFQSSQNQTAVPWNRLPPCLSEVAVMMPSLETLRLSEKVAWGKAKHVDVGQDEADAFIHPSPEVNAAYPKMRIRQAVTGRRVFSEPSTDSDSRQISSVVSFRALVYSERSLRAQCWTAEEASNVSPRLPRKLLNNYLSELSIQRAGKVRKLTSHIEAWVDVAYGDNEK